MNPAILLAAANGLSQVELGSNQSVSDTDPTAATAGFSVNRDGTVTFTGDSVPAGFDWATPKFSTVGDQFHARVNISGDAPDTGPGTGTWVALTSDRSWLWQVTLSGSKSCTATLLISNDGGTTTLDSVVYTVTATIA